MSEVIHFGTTYQDAKDAIDGLVKALEEARAGLSATREQMTGYDDAVREPINQGLQLLGTTIRDRDQILIDLSDGTSANLNRLQENLDQGNGQIQTSRNSVDEEHASFTTQVEEGREGLTQSTDMLRERFEQMFSGIEAMGSAIDESHDATEQAFDDFSSAIRNLTSDLTTLQDDTEEDFETLSKAIVEESAEQLNEIYESLFEQLSGEELDALVDNFERTRKLLQESYENFGELSGELAERLGEIAERVTRNLAEELKESFSRIIKDAMAELLEEVMEALLQEVIKAVALSQAGASLTTAMAPVMPQLIAVKGVISTINGLLDALGL